MIRLTVKTNMPLTLTHPLHTHTYTQHILPPASRLYAAHLVIVRVHTGVDAVGGETGQAALAVGGAVELLRLHEDLVDCSQCVVKHGRLNLRQARRGAGEWPGRAA